MIHVNALIDTGANASNYLSQTLFDRLKDAGYNPTEAKGYVKGGLNTQRQRVECTYSMTFDISFIPEIINIQSNKLNKKSQSITKEATAKLLPIDFDLIIGLPCVRQWELIYTVSIS